MQIEAPRHQLRTIAVGSSKDLQVGQKVFAIGNPFGFDQTITSGIISALNREITPVTGRVIRGAIQTHAAINPAIPVARSQYRGEVEPGDIIVAVGGVKVHSNEDLRTEIGKSASRGSCHPFRYLGSKDRQG